MLPPDRDQQHGFARADYPASTAGRTPGEAMLSPSIFSPDEEAVTAYELKFLITPDMAEKIEAWALANMQLDAFADPALKNAYQTTTLYLDTPQFDTFHRAEGYRRRKYRVRRYGRESRLFVECKKRVDDTVAKRRADLSLDELPRLAYAELDENWPACWFHQHINHAMLRPACRLTYDRVAFVRASDEGPLRLTLDRNIRGMVADTWDLTPVDGGHRILADQVICEFKFRQALPTIFREVIFTLDLQPGNCSKYRRMMLAAGLPSTEDRAHA